MKEQILNWLNKVSEEGLPGDIKAINIGLFKSDSGYTLYLIGAREYDSESADWATEQDFVPKNKYLNIENEELNSMEWEDFLKLVGEVLEEIKAGDEFDNLLLSKVEHVTYGFDDGDLENLI